MTCDDNDKQLTRTQLASHCLLFIKLFHNILMFILSQAIILVVMFAEAVTVMIRQTNHIRVTRALRPVFVLDSYYCRGVRR